MKKIFTLAAAVLASFSLWAAVPAATLDPADVPAEGWAGKYAPASVVNGDWVCFSPYEIYQSSAQTWAATDKGASTDASWNAIDPIPAQSAWTQNDGKAATLRDAAGTSDQKGAYYYRITNTTDVAILAKSGSDGKRTISLAAYELTDGEPAETPAQSATMEKNDNTVISISNLYADKEYLVVVKQIKGGSKGTSEGNSTYCAIGFKTIFKQVDHVDVSLGGVAVNDEALSETQMATLYGASSLDLTAEYVEAPTVTFTVQTDTYYVGETEPSTKSEKIDVVAALNPDGKWQAQQTVGEQTYTITAVKPATVTITYKDGETVLGTEVVAQGETSTKHADFEVKPLAEFQGWYTDAELTSEADLTAAVNADLTLYGKFVKAYAQSLNIEQYILDNGMNNADQDHIGEAFAAVLSGAGYAYSNLNALDTLNDLENKPNRNYAFLGLKMKTAGASIQFNLQAGKTLAVKFGNLTKPVAVTIDGVAQDNHTEGAFLLEAAEADRLIELKTTDKSTVVLQQIMIDEPIAEVTLPDPGAYLITIAESENGTVTANWDNKKYRTPVGATVTLTFTPAEGNIVMSCTVNGTEIHQSAPGAAITFEMPAEDVTIQTTFSLPTAIDNAEAAVKAEKVIRDGQVLILRDGKIFNALGAEVK